MIIVSKKINISNTADKILSDIFFVTFDCIKTDASRIDSEIISIFSGDLIRSNITSTKLKIKEFLDAASPDTCKGAVAEFFAHIFLRSINYTQESLFKNLEESKSIKKGFDGVYKLDEDFYLMESKATDSAQYHNSLISLAVNDLEEKISGVRQNNPWENAVNHAIMSHGYTKFVEKLQIISDKYVSKEYECLANYNIIPCGTVFLNNGFCEEHVCKYVIDKLKEKNIKKALIICINNTLKEDFLKYLEV